MSPLGGGRTRYHLSSESVLRICSRMKRGTKRFAEDSRYITRDKRVPVYIRVIRIARRINSRREGETAGEDGSSYKEITLVVENDAKCTTCSFARYIAIFRRRGDNNIGTVGRMKTICRDSDRETEP